MKGKDNFSLNATYWFEGSDWKPNVFLGSA
jgi:hypothetical protein